MNCEGKFGRGRIKSSVALAFLCLFAHTVLAQPIGQWQTHFNYASAQSVATAKDYVYCATKNGFFYRKRSENKTVLLDSKDGLSETSISRIKYEPLQNTLLIAYESGNLDLLKLTPSGAPEKVDNFEAIRNAPQIEGSRRINHININQSNAYLSCDFGVVVFDLVRQEIRATIRNIGTNGLPIRALSSAFANDSLYISTPGSVLAARFAPNINLQFFGNWTPLSLPSNTGVAGVAAFKNTLFLALRGLGVVKYERGRFETVFATTSAFLQLNELSNSLAIGTTQQLRTTEGVVFSSPQITQPQEATQAEDGTWYIADAGTGLLSAKAGNNLQTDTPNGPSTDVFRRLYAHADRLIALKENTTEPNATLDYYDATTWKTATSTATGSFSGAVFSAADNKTYLSNYGSGLWQLMPDGSLTTAANTPATQRARLTGLTTDRTANLWSVADARFGEATLFLNAKANSAAFPLGVGNVADVLITENSQNNYQWLRLQAGGLLVCDATSATLRTLFLGTGQGSGNLPNAIVNDFVVDADGRVWLATNSGVAVFDNPAQVFAARRPDAFWPVFGTGFLLRNEVCTTIAVDAGNRKWIGTHNGLFLFNENGTELLQNFTVANSPLPTDIITDVAVLPSSGQVFVATPRGVVSYGGDASAPSQALTEIQIYPNPVRPNFTGSVAIKGLTMDCNLKITDITGRLVHETRSQGGTATWNLADYQGNRAQTGVYLILVVNQDGSESLAGKLAVVR